MGVQLLIEVPNQHGTQTVVQAIESYEASLRTGIERTRRRLDRFERRYRASTEQFLTTMAAEDLSGGDLDYVEWAGEAKLLEGLLSELDDLEHARVHLR